MSKLICPVGYAWMKKLQRIKIITIAAGILLSAAFYVLGGSADAVFNRSKDSLIIGESDSESQEETDTKPEIADTATVSADSAQSETAQDILNDFYIQRLEHELYIEADGRGYISDALREEFKTYIRAAIRDELIALCEEGYIERAVSEAADYAAAEAERRAGMVNINTAELTELTTLDGIGEKRAADIIAYREAHGAFNSIEDIMQVSGIKQSSYDKIKDKIYT